MLNNIKAAIFDLDGTLVDSMGIWEKIDIEFLKERGLQVPSDLRDHIEHLSFIDTAKYFKDRFNLNETVEEIMAEWNNMANYEYSNTITLKPGAKEYLNCLKAKGIKLALATSNSHPLLEAVLKNNGVFEYFDSITTTIEVDKGKNHPDIYLLSAKKMNVSPDNCIVFEDIYPAVLGAKAAGMTVAAIYDIYSEHQKEDIIKTADYFIYEYKELIEAC
ncbi:HAD family phosphatase [Clostridium swellfunianum]|uniref:HAD family hydrolase n=1 Tax=Clostridium swellfunianum TaxID=1367462 RepID=UPI002030DE40|nr:HAD family phosphatase [Clostridium swellfunianum]MCM0647823.1 HAD family phosphatase [Clostridium swellfunianum]